jgi:uroporphyrinogen III methyltransferase/synthase
VLVTRPAHQAADFAEALMDAGAYPVVAPLIAFAPPDDAAAAERAASRAGAYAWIVFTSANGAESFFRLLDARREDARLLGTAKVAAIGRMTSAALRRRNVYADLVPQSYVAEDLAHALITASAPGDRILIFRAQEARDVLPQQLQEARRVPEVVAGYKTIAVNDPDLVQKTGACDILTFTSASTVNAFAQNVPDPAQIARGKLVACIGPITAAAARELGMQPDVVAQEYTAQGLLRALEEHVRRSC